MTKVTICPTCRRENDDRREHCHWCGAELPPVRPEPLLAALDILQRLTDRCGMLLRGVAEQTELFGLVDEAKEVLKANAPRQTAERSEASLDAVVGASVGKETR